MYEDILVSVITCVYNTPVEYLREAVNSILAQTHENFEYFIVDDCSDADVYDDDVFKDGRISVIKLEKNSGPAAARNAALEKARGKYIAIMDSDDISFPERFEKQIKFMEENPDVVTCGTWFVQFGDKTNEVKRIIDDNEYYRCSLLFGNAVELLNPSVMIRRSVLEDGNIRYDGRLRKGEDYKMWVQISRLGRCANFPEILLRYRVHKNQTSEKLRTENVSPYDWIVRKEQYDEMGLLLTDDEEELFKKDFKSKEADPYGYFLILSKMLSANEKSKVYDCEKLKKRVREQWKQKIYNTPAKGVFSLMKKLPAKERAAVFRVELERLLVKMRLKRI